MTLLLIFIAVVIFTCVLLNNASSKVGVPVLLAFIVLGILLGNNGILPIHFEDYGFAEKICTVALIFIMFYGGFGVRWNAVKGIAVEAGLLATVGVAFTAGLTGLLCHFILHWGWLESFLMGSVVSSTDAASVFSVLRSRKLGLRNHTAPLLEIESGSNDPMSYMLTAVMLSLMQGEVSGGKVLWMMFSQIVFGAGLGLLIAQAASWLVKRISFATSGFDSLFIFAVALIAYALPSALGGNGYLSAYIVGIVLGNTEFRGRREMVSFFDGLTGLMQVVIFFLLGLLARPAMMNKVILPALAIFAILFFVSRPLSILTVLTPFRKYPFRQQALISFVGLRGAASIVFAISATVGNTLLQNDIFNIVFCIVLLSIALQGTLIPFVAKSLNMIDETSDVMTTFSDFSDETDMQFSEIQISASSPWLNRQVKDLGIPKTILLCMLVHPDGTKVIPNGYTVLQEGDVVILCSKAYHGEHTLRIVEYVVPSYNKYIGKSIKDYPTSKNQIILLRRGEESIIPHGDTILQAGDKLYINKSM